MEEDHSIGDRFNAILKEATHIIIAAAAPAAAYVALVTALIVSIETGALTVFGDAGDFVILLVPVLAFYGVLVVALRQSGLALDGLKGGFGMYFGLSLLSGIAIMFGYLLLVIPGIIMSVRWAPIYGYGMIDSGSVSDAMTRSWDATGPHFWPILLALLIPFGLAVASIAIFASSEFGIATEWFLESTDEMAVALPVSLGSNIAAQLATIASMSIGLAVYSLLRHPQGQVQEVFE